MNNTLLDAPPADRRNLPRRTHSTASTPSPWYPITPKVVYPERLMDSWFPNENTAISPDRRDVSDRRKYALLAKRAAYWPRRVSWILGVVSAVGIGLLLYPILKQETNLVPTSYSSLHSQYQWVGYHRVPPVRI